MSNAYIFSDYIVDPETNKVLIKSSGQIVQCSDEVADFICKSYWNEQYNNRKHKDVLSYDAPINEDQSIKDLLVSKDNTEGLAIKEQELSEINEMIASLPKKLQDMYRYYYSDGKKCIDIAKLMDCTNDTVTHRKNKLAEKLHKFAEERGYEIEDFEH